MNSNLYSILRFTEQVNNKRYQIVINMAVKCSINITKYSVIIIMIIIKPLFSEDYILSTSLSNIWSSTI